MAKRKRKLKKKFKITLVFIVVIIIGIIVGVNLYNDYLYKQTNEYKLLELGYTDEETKLIENNLLNDDIDYLLNNELIAYVDDIISEKYFIKANFLDYIEYYEENSDISFSDLVAIVNVGASSEWYTDTSLTDLTKGYSILVNKFNLLPSDYDPGTIKTFSSTYAYGDVSAEEECYYAFINMADDAREDGITLIVTSGYRTNEYQESLYNSMLKSKGQTYADNYAARAGASEHETGLALDVFTPGATTDMFHETEAYAWLSEYAQNYGFILRYPEDKEYLTGYSPESWHYRYVGVELATKIKNEGITYDEYYAYYLA